ncbi:hypothetical protein [Crassaminicella thermophila]|uniref:hypothetical protein n=1 Tax=Crassaminicella thermophila TaxID=2599308 RepID=UPI00143D2A3C|nr:hypothetical protein [Crassaminicella thermophila]
MKKILSTKEKTIDRAENALNRLLKGISTINEIRQEYGLNLLKNNDANEKMTIKD